MIHLNDLDGAEENLLPPPVPRRTGITAIRIARVMTFIIFLTAAYMSCN